MDFDEFKFQPDKPQKMARTDDHRITSFQEWFDKDPRQAQVDVFEFVCDNVAQDSLTWQLPQCNHSNRVVCHCKKILENFGGVLIIR